MKPANSEQAWDQLVQRARRDPTPPVDVAALRRVVLAEWPPLSTTAVDWRAQLLQICSVSRALRWSLSGTTACAVAVGWQVWQLWQDLAWAQYAGLGMGGGW